MRLASDSKRSFISAWLLMSSLCPSFWRSIIPVRLPSRSRTRSLTELGLDRRDAGVWHTSPTSLGRVSLSGEWTDECDILICVYTNQHYTFTQQHSTHSYMDRSHTVISTAFTLACDSIQHAAVLTDYM